jgi:hypothetical protein
MEERFSSRPASAPNRRPRARPRGAGPDVLDTRSPRVAAQGTHGAPGGAGRRRAGGALPGLSTGPQEPGSLFARRAAPTR